MDKEKLQYLENKLKHIVEAMTFQLLCEKPDDPVRIEIKKLNFFIEWLQTTGGYTANGKMKLT